MLPFIAGCIILLLTVLGIIGAIILYSGLKSVKSEGIKPFSVGKIVFGCLSVGFVIYNWLGYNSMFSENERRIIGDYKCHEFDVRLTLKKDYTWEIKGNIEGYCKKGSWEYVMSEDWCYWNIESENKKCRTQTVSPKTIFFKDQNLKFERINQP